MTGDHLAVLVRHGETEWSRQGRHTGRSEVPLTDRGREQAREAGRSLAGMEFALILVSPLGRARETLALAGLRGPVEVCGDLREWDYGEYEGRTTPEIRAERPGWWLWRDGVVGGEALEEVGRRADRVVAAVRAVDGDVAVVAHGHILRVLAARWTDLPPSVGGRLVLTTATISALGFERETPAVTLWNSPCASTARLRR
jgi:broad specificity phosphatase PhoE